MKKLFTFFLALAASVGMSWALTPREGDAWDDATKTLTVNSNTSDNAYASKTDIKHLIVSDAVTELGWGTFFFDSLMTTVELGNNLEIIGISAFNECRSLSTITVPASVTNIKVRAFQDCRSLTTFICEAVTPPTIGNAIFQNANNLTAIYVPAASVGAYKTAWSDYASLIKAIPAPEPTYLDADFAIDFRTNPYTVVGGGALPTGVEVTGNFNDGQHGYSSPVITIPVTAGNYLVKMGTCQFSNQDGSVKNEDGSVTYTTLATNTGVCYDADPSKNYVADIITIPSDQIIKVYGAQYTPYFSIRKMPEIPAFTDFELNFQTNPYSVSGTMPTGTNIAGTYHDNQHGYQNVEATIPMEAGTYRLTLGACQYGNGEGNVMSETNIELASFNQNLGENKCYHQNPSANIVSVTFTVDIDQNITINGGAYVPYMKLEAVTSYAVEFALGDAEGTAPAALDVTVGDEITMPVNKTMYKEGYTLTGWSDGVNTYPIGNSFTPANDVVLTPVFTANQADLLNASTDVTVKWYFGGDNGAPTTSYEGTSGLLVAQATIGDKTVDVKLSINATSGKFAPQSDTEWAQVNVGTIFTYPYKEGITVNVDNYKSKVTYYIADAEGKVTCGENDYYSFIQVTYPASTPGPSTAIDNANANANTVKVIRNGQLLIEKNGKIYNVMGAEVK